jgi:predicted P-loop ATPase
VYRAIEELLPGLYEPVDTEKGRYTYLGGSTTGGAVVYDTGKFLYSHHATDPCSGRLVNAFDLVRLHRFAELDDAADPAAPSNKLPSYKKMCELANSIDDVAVLLMRERYDSAIEDFQGVSATNDGDPANWMLKLQRAPQSGEIKNTIDNVRIILENDPLLKGRFALNQFAGRGEVLMPLPWSVKGDCRRMWSDTDSNGLYWYMEKQYGITGRGNIDAALDIHAATHAFNEVQDYIEGLVWDGTPRLDSLFIDYLGAADTEYNRAVCRKAFTAAVARAMTPGCKYDHMLILCGPQGIGKSTILDKMSRGFFNDSIRTFEGKEASELLQGVWIVEISELDAFRRSDVARIKQFLSLRADRYRAAYGRNVKELPRCCIFFGTSNPSDFLQDTTGNRRFWPVDVGVIPPIKSVFAELDGEVDQLWAEAKVRWQVGESLYLTGALEEAARAKQEEHREANAQEGLISEFVARQVPDDWMKWEVSRRRDYWGNLVRGELRLVERKRITAVEIWCELYMKNISDMKKSDAREINAVLANLPGWKRSEKTLHFGPYSTQWGFVRW